jgi:hypothetical protein
MAKTHKSEVADSGRISQSGQNRRLVNVALAIALLAVMAAAQAGADAQKPTNAVTPATPSVSGTVKASPYRPRQLTMRAKDHYELLWGIDSLQVKAVESGQMIRFSYLVLDPVKAAQLNDKKANPALIDTQARVRLDVPTMEKVGQLRQTSTPEAGKTYWMVFSNKGALVKPGDRVSIAIGKFQADGLLVH